MNAKDFLKVFGRWKIEMKSPDGRVKEISVQRLCDLFNDKPGRFFTDERGVVWFTDEVNNGKTP
jgi:hypothetical protein